VIKNLKKYVRIFRRWGKWRIYAPITPKDRNTTSTQRRNSRILGKPSTLQNATRQIENQILYLRLKVFNVVAKKSIKNKHISNLRKRLPQKIRDVTSVSHLVWADLLNTGKLAVSLVVLTAARWKTF